MSKKDKWMLAGLALLVLFMLSPYLIAGIPSDDDCPAPDDLESMEVYQFLSQAVHEDTTPDEAIEAFARMCEIPVKCRDDQILIECRYSEYSDSFNIHIVRQFEFSDSLEYVQLHLDLTYSAEEMTEYPNSLAWYDTGNVDIRDILTQWDAFAAVEGMIPDYAGVAIDWTW